RIVIRWRADREQPVNPPMALTALRQQDWLLSIASLQETCEMAFEHRPGTVDLPSHRRQFRIGDVPGYEVGEAAAPFELHIEPHREQNLSFPFTPAHQPSRVLAGIQGSDGQL